MVKEDYDLETTPLEIKTDSVLGSNEQMFLVLYSAGGEWTGSIQILFKSTVQYGFGWCSRGSYTDFPATLPSSKDKIWRITLTRTSGVRLRINCNDVEVLDVVLSDRVCSDNRWSTNWNGDVERIEFRSRDTASDHYRPYIIGE